MEQVAFDFQIAFNIAAGVAGVLFGYLLRSMEERIKEAHARVDDVERRTHSRIDDVERRLVEAFDRFARRDDMAAGFDRLDRKLDQIMTVVSGKADK